MTRIQYLYLYYHPYSAGSVDLVLSFIAIFCSTSTGSSSGADVAFICYVSLASLNLEYFRSLSLSLTPLTYLKKIPSHLFKNRIYLVVCYFDISLLTRLWSWVHSGLLSVWSHEHSSAIVCVHFNMWPTYYPFLISPLHNYCFLLYFLKSFPHPYHEINKTSKNNLRFGCPSAIPPYNPSCPKSEHIYLNALFRSTEISSFFLILSVWLWCSLEIWLGSFVSVCLLFVFLPILIN